MATSDQTDQAEAKVIGNQKVPTISEATGDETGGPYGDEKAKKAAKPAPPAEDKK